MELSEILQKGPKRKNVKRTGRGPGSGTGKTSGKGHKGQKSRSGKGSRIRPGFEGGQMPLYRRLPKRGFNHMPNRRWSIVNVSVLNQFENGANVTPEDLLAKGLIKGTVDSVKILGGGVLEKKLTVKAHHFSRHALKKIEKAKGKIEVLANQKQTEISKE